LGVRPEPRTGRAVAGDGDETDGAVHAGDADGAVDDAAERARLAELVAGDRSDEVELRERDEAPVQGADDHEGCCEQIGGTHDLPPFVQSLWRERTESSNLVKCL
jgi:hypothetical protein